MYRAKTNNGTSVKRFESYSPSHFILCTLNDEYEWVRFVSTHISYIFFSFVDIPLFGVAIMVVAAVVVSFSAKTVLDLCVLFIRIHKWLLCSPAAWYYVILMLSDYARTPNLFEIVCRHNHRVVVCMYVVARLHENMPTDSPICVCIGMCIRENSTAALYPNRLDFGQEFSLEKGFFIVSNDSCLQQSDTNTVNCSRLRRQ